MNIRISRLQKKFEESTVFQNFNCEFSKGDISVIMGKSGVGKTTLLRILMGLESYEGSITGLEGERISAVFQENRLLEGETVFENLAFVASRASREEIIAQLSEVGLEEWVDKPVSVLSGGMKRRVALVRGLLVPSTVLVMDEPFKDVDESTREVMIQYFLNHRNRRTVIMSTHDKIEASELADRIIDMDGLCKLEKI